MNKFVGKKNILWDFDGVLVDSHEVRKEGFVKTLQHYPVSEVEKLLKFHIDNGGLSRYVKFRYFFEKIRAENVSEEKVQELSTHFSEIMRSKLIDPQILIADSLEYVKNNYEKIDMHIISGSDEKELQFLCHKLGIEKYFCSINGSPIPKVELVKRLMRTYQYDIDKTIFIGDSINDYEAAKENNLAFYGYNNPSLRDVGAGYIENFG